MRIMVISTLYPELDKPNLKKDTSAIKYFVDGWIKEGQDVLVLHPYRIPIINFLTALFDRDRFRVLCSQQGSAKVLLTQTQLLIPHKYIPFNAQQHMAAKKIKRYIEQDLSGFEPDVIAVSFPLTNLKFCEDIIGKRKALCVIHKSDILDLEKLQSKKRNEIIAKLRSLFNKICFRSDVLKKRGLALGIADEENPVLYSGIDNELILPEEEMKRKISSSWEGRPLELVYAGNLEEQKSVDVLIKAVGIARDSININFRILGDGSEMQKLQCLATQLNIQDCVKFEGRVPRRSVVDAMRAADVFAMVSTNETFGMVYIEALAQGCIVIGTRDDGIDGVLVDGYNGFLVEPNNPEAVAIKLCEIASLQDYEGERLITAALSTANQMTADNMNKKYLQVLVDVVEEREHHEDINSFKI